MLARIQESLGLSGMGKSLFRKSGSGAPRKEAVLKGGAVGAAAGAALGGTATYLEGKYEISRLPLNTVDLSWEEALIEPRTLGKVPRNYYVASHITSGSEKMGARLGYDPVIVEAPVVGYTGEPVMKEQHQTVQSRGTPVVTWTSHQIKDPFLTGYEEHVSKEGTGEYPYHHTFTPRIEQSVVGEYQTPRVTFETGVNLLSRALWGVFLGMGVGALAGAILTALAQKGQKQPQKP